MRAKELFEEISDVRKADILTIQIPPQLAARCKDILLEEKKQLEEGKWQKWDNDYDIRLDRRPDDQGGNQLHLRGRKGKQWAYRHTGQKSERSKYTLPSTNAVRDIVARVFNLPQDKIEEVEILDAGNGELLIEPKLVK